MLIWGLCLCSIKMGDLCWDRRRFLTLRCCPLVCRSRRCRIMQRSAVQVSVHVLTHLSDGSICVGCCGRLRLLSLRYLLASVRVLICFHKWRVHVGCCHGLVWSLYRMLSAVYTSEHVLTVLGGWRICVRRRPRLILLSLFRLHCWLRLRARRWCRCCSSSRHTMAAILRLVRLN